MTSFVIHQFYRRCFVCLQHGITQTSELVNVTDFFNSHIVPDLQSSDGKNQSLIHPDIGFVFCTAVCCLLYICF